MPIQYRVLPEHDLLIGVFIGIVTPSEYMNGVVELSQNPDFRPDFDRLGIHHRSLDLSQFAFSDIVGIRDKMLSAYYKGAPPPATDRPLYRLAAVCDAPMNQKMVKLYGATLNTGMPSPIAVETFQTLEAALIWLGRENLIDEFNNDDWRAFITPDAGF